MHAATYLVALLAGFAAAATTRVQLEIDNDTFIQKEVNTPGSINQNSNLITASVVRGNGNCKALNGKRVVGTFNKNNDLKVKKQKITQIQCN